jgi:DNA-binding response OmpR family regulator
MSLVESSSKLHIHIVEDDPTLGGILGEIIRFYGHNTTLFPNSTEALANFQIAQPDAVIMDFYTQGLRGDELASRMRAINPRVPLILLTGADAEVIEPISQFFDQTLRKPADIEILTIVLQGIPSMQQKLRDSYPTNFAA